MFYIVRLNLNMWNVCFLFTAAEVLSFWQWMSLPGALRSKHRVWQGHVWFVLSNENNSNSDSEMNNERRSSICLNTLRNHPPPNTQAGLSEAHKQQQLTGEWSSCSKYAVDTAELRMSADHVRYAHAYSFFNDCVHGCMSRYMFIECIQGV